MEQHGFVYWGIAAIEAVIALIVIFRLPEPTGPNPFGSPSSPAASGQALIRGFKKYTVFTGRATKSEFWWFTFWYVLVGTATTVFAYTFIFSNIMPGPMAKAFPLLTLLFALPFVAITVRRLQDANRSGLWSLLYICPLGFLPMIVLLIEPSRDILSAD